VITLELAGRRGRSRIIIGERLANLGRYSGGGRPGVIVTDRNVHRLYAGSFPPWPVVVIQPGEENKTLRTVSGIYREFLRLNVDRQQMVVGVGGGVVCDAAGFAASTYLRGLEFGFVATTLLAQVDAALGGKNGVNLHGYKNLVGTFSQPRFVISDLAMLRTLPEREVRCGLAEVIKAAAIADRRLFDFLEKNADSCLSLERAAVEYAVERSCRVKVGIVGRDEHERGERRKLNFGHTLGHALERTSRLSHGEAVAVGMAAAARLSVKRCGLSREEEGRLTGLLKRAGLPVVMKTPPGPLRGALTQDKKRKAGRIRFVLLQKLGRAVVEEVGPEEVIEAADDLR
jgi:3-dehydroquinate synthase